MVTKSTDKEKKKPKSLADELKERMLSGDAPIKEKKTDISDIDVMKEIVEFRYKTFNLKQAKDKLMDRLSYLDNLTDFTFSILQPEGAIKTKEMPMNLQMEITAVIMEELKKKGVPEKAIVGEKTI